METLTPGRQYVLAVPHPGTGSEELLRKQSRLWCDLFKKVGIEVVEALITPNLHSIQVFDVTPPLEVEYDPQPIPRPEPQTDDTRAQKFKAFGS